MRYLFFKQLFLKIKFFYLVENFGFADCFRRFLKTLLNLVLNAFQVFRLFIVWPILYGYLNAGKMRLTHLKFCLQLLVLVSKRINLLYKVNLLLMQILVLRF